LVSYLDPEFQLPLADGTSGESPLILLNQRNSPFRKITQAVTSQRAKVLLCVFVRALNGSARPQDSSSGVSDHPTSPEHNGTYVALLLYPWVSFGPGIGLSGLLGTNRVRALRVGVEAVEPKTILVNNRN
jgi:hypothetical protein